MNCSVIGNICRDIEVKEITGQNGLTQVANFSIAENVSKDHVNYWECQAFGKTAINIQKYLGKGKKIAITSGTINQRQYEKDGVKKVAYSLTINTCDLFCNGKTEHVNEQTQQSAPQQTPIIKPADVDDDLPF